MKYLFLIPFCIFCISVGYTQHDKFDNLHFKLKAGLGVHRFHINGYATENYPSFASKLGIGISKYFLDDKIEVESGIDLLLRIKSESPLVEEMLWTGKGYYLPFLDKTATENHTAIEIPVGIRFHYNSENALSSGLIIRHWGPKSSTDILASQTELVYCIGISRKLTSRLISSINCNLGVSKIWNATLVVSGNSSPIIIRNQNALFSISYLL